LIASTVFSSYNTFDIETYKIGGANNLQVLSIGYDN